MAAQLDRQVSGDEFSGLIGRTRPKRVVRRAELLAAKRSDEREDSHVNKEPQQKAHSRFGGSHTRSEDSDRSG